MKDQIAQVSFYYIYICVSKINENHTSLEQHE